MALGPNLHSTRLSNEVRKTRSNHTFFEQEQTICKNLRSVVGEQGKQRLCVVESFCVNVSFVERLIDGIPQPRYIKPGLLCSLNLDSDFSAVGLIRKIGNGRKCLVNLVARGREPQ